MVYDGWLHSFHLNLCVRASARNSHFKHLITHESTKRLAVKWNLFIFLCAVKIVASKRNEDRIVCCVQRIASIIVASMPSLSILMTNSNANLSMNYSILNATEINKKKRRKTLHCHRSSRLCELRNFPNVSCYSFELLFESSLESRSNFNKLHQTRWATLSIQRLTDIQLKCGVRRHFYRHNDDFVHWRNCKCSV